MDAVPLPVHRLSHGAQSRRFLRLPAPVVVPALVILGGLLLRLSLLGLDVRFHPDEALFAAQARLVSHGGDLLLRDTDLDKPPLTFYVTAASFRLLGVSEFAARLPNVLASGASLAVLYALGWRLYRDRAVAILAALLWALSPYDLAFAATVFTDVQATCWALVALWLAAADRWHGAGIAAALVFAAKTNGMAIVPLVIALGIARNAGPDWTWRDVARRVWRLVWPLALGIALVLLWDAARAPRSFWELNLAHNDPGRWSRSAELEPRLRAWAHWLGMITASRALNWALVVGGGLWIGSGLIWRRDRGAALDVLIAGYGVAFLAVHWLVAFNTYDRYIHALVPLALLLAARAIVGSGRALAGILPGAGARSGPVTAIFALLAVGALLPGTWTALHGDAALGGDQGRHTGIDSLAAVLNEDLGGQVVYDHWLGWELAYYLGRTHPVTLAYTPLPEALAADMATQTHARYLVAPSPAQAAPWLVALARVEVAWTVHYHDAAHGFVVYRLEPARRPLPG